MPKKDTTQSQTKPQTNPLIAENSKLTLTIPWEKIQAAYKKALARASQNLKTDGFRKGKVPPAMAEKMLDQEHLYEHALNALLPAAYTEAIKTAKKLPISQPEVEPVSMEKGKDWVLTVYFAEQPEVKLGEYSKAVVKASTDAEKEITETIGKQKADDKPITDAQKDDVRIKHIFKALVETVQPMVPELLIRQEVNRELQRLADQLQQFKLSAEDFLKSRNMTLDQLQQEYAASALGSLQLEFILAEVTKTEKLQVTDVEMNEVLNKVGDGKMTEEQKQNSDYRSYIFSNLIKQKVLKHLLSMK